MKHLSEGTALRSALCALALALGVATTPAAASVRTGATTDGTRVRLSGKRITVKLPKTVIRGSLVRVSCGREGTAGHKVTSASERYSHGRRLGLQFRTDVSRIAEWCYFDTSKHNVDARRLPDGAVTLRPALGSPPADLQSGPGVREAVTTSTDGAPYGGLQGEDGDARFLLKANVLTVRLRTGFRHSQVVRIGCVAGTSPDNDRVLAYRSLVLPARRQVVSADLEGTPGPEATSCLAEGTGGRSGDIAAANFR